MNYRSLFGFAASLVLTAALFVNPSAAKAQEPEARPDQGISRSNSRTLQGTWRLQLTVFDCQTGQVQRTFPALATFAKGGTLTLTTAGQIPAQFTTQLGVWWHTDDRNYSAVSEGFLFSPTGTWIQTNRFTRAIEVDRDGDEFTDSVVVEMFDTSGNLTASGCGRTVARRFE